MIRIEAPSGAADWARIREICCETAYSGAGLNDPLREKFFGRYWVGPYERLLPAWTRVARDEGKILGYLTGCPDTRAFARRKLVSNDLPLLAQVLTGAYPKTQDTRLFARRFFRLEKTSDDYFSADTRAALRASYPAHLHVNLVASARGKGVGRLLMEDFFARLRALGVPGVHVQCGASPVEFYRKTGFAVLETQKTDAGTPIFVMGKPLSA